MPMGRRLAPDAISCWRPDMFCVGLEGKWWQTVLQNGGNHFLQRTSLNFTTSQEYLPHYPRPRWMGVSNPVMAGDALRHRGVAAKGADAHLGNGEGENATPSACPSDGPSPRGRNDEASVFHKVRRRGRERRSERRPRSSGRGGGKRRLPPV